MNREEKLATLVELLIIEMLGNRYTLFFFFHSFSKLYICVSLQLVYWENAVVPDQVYGPG